MKYISTRGKSEEVSSAQAIKNGLCPDGGLYVPESIPTLSEKELKRLSKLDYAGRAAKIISMFLTDYPKDELEALCRRAYSPERFGEHPAPVKKAGDLNVLELWHGPTCAFKDMALQLTPLLLSAALRLTGEKRTANILVATSGDTGKAALEGFCDVEQTKIAVFYPANGVSALQKLQMTTQEGKNVCVTGIDGNFDDAQTAVKTIFSDREFAESISDRSFFSSANSINWGRLVPQVVYYVSAYLDMASSGTIAFGDSIDVCVPTGNFGDILAGYIAKKMGVKISKLICASNSNRVLTDFFDTGLYDRRREFFTTVSPSMDILISSNLERMLYFVCGAEKTAGYMKDLSEKGSYHITPDELEKMREDYEGLCCDEQNTLKTVKEFWEKEKYLCDPHTAVALNCAKRYAADHSNPILVLSTASPYKFTPSVCKALGLGEAPDAFAAADILFAATGAPIPAGIEKVRKKPVRFPGCIAKDKIKDAVKEFLG
ncbi:MAG: threonine synthase [Clostridia bacterium]|nr:threonine synthase [Clostridia bacterium]